MKALTLGKFKVEENKHLFNCKDLDEIGRSIIQRLKHDEGSPKGEVWCDGYHEGLADMLIELKKELESDVEDYQAYCDSMFETDDKPLPYEEWKKIDEEKHNES